ncbi:MAG: hypothetical protein RBT63_02985 [Bdellovibrionales bacterium]|jgi:hypothetical protein|nr:hypothetical protein [Bdellovibrionales bacterium]
MDNRLNLRSWKSTSLLTALVVPFCFISLCGELAHGAILFEGWSKVMISGKHVGYVVQRYEFDEKKKEFRATHFLKTNADAGALTESLDAKADSSFKPRSYQYTGIIDKQPTTVDATFKGDRMTALITTGKEKKTVSNAVPKGAFLSAFLGYVMLQGKEGLKKGVKYEYQGILEESATIVKGEAFIAEEEVISGIPAFRILNSVSGSRFISLATHKAEILGTSSPSLGLQTILVATQEEAVAGHGLNATILNRLFGSIPSGKENEIARRASLPPSKQTPATQPTLNPQATPATQPTPAAES